MISFPSMSFITLSPILSMIYQESITLVLHYKIKLSFVENLPDANLAIVLTFLKICAVNDCIQCKQFTENWFHFKHMKIYE